MEHILLLSAALIVTVITIVLFWQWMSTTSAIKKHPMLGNIRYKKLSASSPTRQRFETASKLFAEGWKVLQSTDLNQSRRSIQLFAMAAEIDEMACGWKQDFELKLEMIGDLFSIPSEDKEFVYHSMLAEAYLVLLLYTVVALYGKPSEDVEEDYRYSFLHEMPSTCCWCYHANQQTGVNLDILLLKHCHAFVVRVIKSRLDQCVKLQPKNPAVYKLRGDWCGRFSNQSDPEACIHDFQKAVRLAESDPDGSNLNTHGVEPQVQRNYILSYSHFQLGILLQHKKDFEASQFHYEAVIKYADSDFVQLPDTYFNLAILTLLTVQPDDDRIATLSRAGRYYKNGMQAGKKLRRWFPSPGFDVSQKLAKALISKFSTSSQGAKAAEAGSDKKKK